MKSRLWSLLAAMVTASLLASLAPPLVRNAMAVATVVTISPTNAPVGASVTVTGGVAAGAPYRIRWDSPATGQILASGTATAGGVVNSVVLIPAGASDVIHNIYLVDMSDLTNYSVPFAITPAIAISSYNGRSGDAVVVTGTGFAASETGVMITWDWVDLVSVGAVTTNGGWSKTIIIPSALGGLHHVSAHGDSTALPAVMEAPFLLLSNLAISPASGPVGTTITASGTGFASGETEIRVLWGGVDGFPIKTGITASPAGAWSATFTAPASAAGDHIVDAQGPITTPGQVPDRVFAVSRGLSVSPNSGVVGTTVTVAGSGFPGGVSALTVTYDGAKLATAPDTVTSTSSGNVSANFVVPSSGAGAHAVVLADALGSAAAAFTVTPSVNLTLASAEVGGQSTINGLGFPPNSAVSLAFDGPDNIGVLTIPARVVTDSAGAFTATFTAPPGARGGHDVRVAVGAVAMTTTFTVSSSLAVEPASGLVGSPVTVAGKGFSPGAPIMLSFDGVAVVNSLTQVTSSALGSFTALIVLPAAPRGAHTIVASDGVGTAQAAVGIMPGVTIGAATVNVGTILAVTGAGLAANASITATADGAVAFVDGPPLVTDALGGFSARVSVPPGAAGSHTLSFSDGVAEASVNYTVVPNLSASPATGNVGSTVALTGTGFPAGKAIALTYDGKPIAPGPAPLMSSAYGGFQASIAIPAGKSGQHDIVVSDGAGSVLRATFTMESTPPRAPMLLAPAASGRIGTFGAEAPAFAWAGVPDPSGVTYTLQVSTQPGFSPLALEKSGIKDNRYSADKKQALGAGRYYWRVRAVDGASNVGPWSQTSTFNVGFLPAWMPLSLLLALAAIVLALLFLVIYRRMLSRGER